MANIWKPGENVVLRGVYNERVWIAQSAVVVKDSEQEVALAILPGAECVMPEGYITGKHGPTGQWDRWGDYLRNDPDLQRFIWHTNRLLILMEPEKYYGMVYIWNDSTNLFSCYYINFQLPFKRSSCGFDTLDLELDILVEPTYEWRWKDREEYQQGIDRGILLEEWVKEIDAALLEVFEKLEKREYPFDGSWLAWIPDPTWAIPTLPENWDKI